MIVRLDDTKQVCYTLPMPPKYLLCPGYVTSQTDGQEHYLSGRSLARLYGVSLQDCTLAHDDQMPPPDLIYLRPRYDGNYTLPEGPK